MSREERKGVHVLSWRAVRAAQGFLAFAVLAISVGVATLDGNPYIGIPLVMLFSFCSGACFVAYGFWRDEP